MTSSDPLHYRAWAREAPYGLFAPFATLKPDDQLPAPVFPRFPDIMGGHDQLAFIRQTLWNQPVVRINCPDLPPRTPLTVISPQHGLTYLVHFERRDYTMLGERNFMVCFMNQSDVDTFKSRMKILQDDLDKNGPFVMPF